VNQDKSNRDPSDTNEAKRLKRNRMARIRRREREAILRSIGLIKVRSATGKVFWE
jgi:hypothetical protein